MTGLKKLKGYLMKNGIKNTAAKVYEYMLYKKRAGLYMSKNALTEEELKFQREYRFIRGIKFSVVVPLYNSDPQYLDEMIKSVISQTYGKWELILVDGSPLSYTAGEETAMKYVSEDKRVRYRRLGGNLGISENTNIGVSAGSGEYIVFLDHDDILSPQALFRAAEAIEKTKVDFLYSDEMNFRGSPENISAVTIKPDFSKYTLWGINYIGHMCVVKRELFDKAGRLRSEFDGSQDYDLVLRLSEKAEKICHIPYVLYYWRMHSGSVASGIEAKSYCLEKAKEALREHFEGLGVQAEISDITGAESAYRLKINYDKKTKISLIICFSGSKRQFERYMAGVFEALSENEVEIISVGGYNIYDKVRNIDFSQDSGFSKMANMGARKASGSLLMFLDGRVLPRAGFLEETAEFCLFEDVGCAGGKLVDGRGLVYAAGFRLDGEEGLVPYLKGLPQNCTGYMRRLKTAGNVSCLYGGFMMVKRKDFISVGGFDEKMGPLGCGADLCLRLSNRGNIVLNPYAVGVVSGRLSENLDEFYSLNRYAAEAGDKFLKEL